MQDEFSLLEAQQLIHELIAQRAPLERTLDAIANWLNVVLPDATVAFMRYEPRRCTLSLLPNHRFSTFYTKRLQDVPVAPRGRILRHGRLRATPGGKQWDGVLPTLHRRRCATLVGENITDQPEDEENSP